MFGKLRTGHLVIVLAALALVWWVSGLVSPRAQQRTFREEIMRLDTGSVSEFTITPALFKGLPPLTFRRADGGWRMYLGPDSSAVDTALIHDVLRSCSLMRVSRLAGRMADVRDRYELGDSTADRLTIIAADGPHDLLVGRHTFSEAPMTVVNPPGDVNAYAIEGLLGKYTDFTFGEWMPKYLVTGDPRNWTRLTFDFPGDTGYAMERTPDGWLLDGVPADTARVERFLKSLARARGQSVTDPADTLVAIPQFRLVVEDATRSAPIVVIVYVSDGKFIVRSSLNPGSVMPFDGREEVPRMFRPRTAYLPR